MCGNGCSSTSFTEAEADDYAHFSGILRCSRCGRYYYAPSDYIPQRKRQEQERRLFMARITALETRIASMIAIPTATRKAIREHVDAEEGIMLPNVFTV